MHDGCRGAVISETWLPCIRACRRVRGVCACAFVCVFACAFWGGAAYMHVCLLNRAAQRVCMRAHTLFWCIYNTHTHARTYTHRQTDTHTRTDTLELLGVEVPGMAQTEARQVLESLGFKAGGQSRYMVRINRACLHLALPFRPSVAKVMRMSVRLHLALQLRILRQSVARVMKVLSLSLSPSLMNMSVRVHLALVLRDR